MNRQEVMNALEQAVEHQVCKDRTLRFDGMERDYCVPDLMYDALALLKAQKPRVMTPEEVRGSLKRPIWKEVRSSHKDLYTGWVLAYDIQTGQGITGTRLGMAEPSGRIAWYRLEDYGTKWRCWTSRPTDEQRRDTPWE